MTHEKPRPDGTFKGSYGSALVRLMDRWANGFYKNECAMKTSWTRSPLQSLRLCVMSCMTSWGLAQQESYCQIRHLNLELEWVSPNKPVLCDRSLPCYCVISDRKQTRAVYCTTSSFKTFCLAFIVFLFSIWILSPWVFTVVDSFLSSSVSCFYIMLLFLYSFLFNCTFSFLHLDKDTIVFFFLEVNISLISSSSFFFVFYLLSVCMCVCIYVCVHVYMCVHVMPRYMWGGQRTSPGSCFSLPFLLFNSWGSKLVIQLGGRYLYQLSHLTGLLAFRFCNLFSVYCLSLFALGFSFSIPPVTHKFLDYIAYLFIIIILHTSKFSAIPNLAHEKCERNGKWEQGSHLVYMSESSKPAGRPFA